MYFAMNKITFASSKLTTKRIGIVGNIFASVGAALILLVLHLIENGTKWYDIPIGIVCAGIGTTCVLIGIDCISETLKGDGE